MHRVGLKVRDKKVLKLIGKYLRGWFHYFKPGLRYKHMLDWDHWIRRRVRLCFWKQWKRPRRRRKMLIQLGADRDTVYLASRSRKGYWRMSSNSIVQRALNVQWLKDQGVLSLADLWIAYTYPPKVNQAKT